MGKFKQTISIGLLLSMTMLHLSSSKIVIAQEDDRDPERVAGTRGRSNCQVADTPDRLTALVAERGDMVTSSTTPSFLFYVPEPSNPPLNATFRLQNRVSNRNLFSPMNLTLNATPGVIRIQIPKSVQAGQRYRWSFQIDCGSEKQFSVSGGLVYKQPSASLAKQLAGRITPLQKAMLYRKEGFILDALAALAEARSTDPKAEAEWSGLLESLALDNIAQKKSVPCCQAR